MRDLSFYEISRKALLRLLVGSSLVFFCFSLANSKVSAEEFKTEEWVENAEKSSINVMESNLEAISPEAAATQDEFIWLHNDGEEIANDVISGETDFYLEAVSKDTVNGIEIIDYYFNEIGNDERTIEDIKTTVNERQIENQETLSESLNANSFSTMAIASVANPVIRNFNWTFNSKAHYITTSVEMSRKSKTATINGVKGSVWDVVSNTQYERKSGLRYLNDLYTRLAIPYTNQTLLDWGPATTKSSTVSVSLSGAGVPGLSYSFNTGVRYNTYDLSSKSSKYGRWKFARALYPIYSNKLSARPSIRATNTKGAFALQLSHSLEFDNVTNNTGVITISTPDR